MYNNSEDSWDWKFTERSKVLALNSSTPLAENGVEAPGMYGSVNYDTWEMNNLIDGYSDLSYEEYSLTIGATYDFSDAFYTNVSATYDVFESDEEYVYGDEDGKAYSGYLAFGYKF